MKFRIYSKSDADTNPDVPPNQLGIIVDVKGHLYIYDNLHIRAIYPAASPMIIAVQEDFEVENCIDLNCKHLVAKKPKPKERKVGVITELM